VIGRNIRGYVTYCFIPVEEELRTYP